MTADAAARPLPVAADARRRECTVRYSICTLVTRPDQYREMVASFEAGGFTGPDCEYLFLDNSTGNHHEAFAGYNLFLTVARGEYVILCHQDVLLLEDDRAVLDRRLEELTRREPTWGVCGNAGGIRPGELAIRISDPEGEDQRVGTLPARVTSLDENFLVVRRDANLALSRELQGFHFYGAELCLVADLLGYSAHVIDFHLRHWSGGNADEHFEQLRAAIVARYESALRPRWMTTTVVSFFVSGSPLLNRLVYSRHGRRLFRHVQRWLALAARHGIRATYGSRPLPDVTEHHRG